MQTRSAVALFLGTALAAASCGAALGGNPHGAKVDDQVAAIVDGAGTTPDTPLNVIVIGSNPGAAVSRYGVKRRDLGALNADGATITAGALDAVAADPGVSAVVPDAPVALADSGDGSGQGRGPGAFSGSGSVSFPNLATLYPQVDDAGAAWSSGLTGRGIGIAVIDSGVASAPDFGSRLVNVDVGDGVTDTVGHGTLVAGVAAGSSPDGRYVGIAPGATVYAVDVNPGSGGPRTSDVIAGLLWVAQNEDRYNIRVVNLSLEETVPSSYKTSLLDAVVELLWARGVIVVTAAGNGGAGAVDFAPANDPFAVSVGASDTADTADSGDDTLASFSAYGTTVDGVAKPEIVAPGRHIVSLLPAGTVLAAQAPAQNWVSQGYASIGGTSFAAPQVAGAAALLVQEHPSWTPDQVKWVLGQTTRPLAGSAAGALDLAAATGFSGTPGSANQGLVSACSGPCASSFGRRSGLGGLVWNGAARSGNTWNGNTWSGNTWSGHTWSSATWNGATWSGATWSAGTWK